MIVRQQPIRVERHAPIDPATWAHTRSFLAILEESGIETARAQFFLTHAEAEAVCAWANAPTRKNPTVIIIDDDPETEDFRPADPREHAEYYQVGDRVYISAAPGGSLETSTIPPGGKCIVPEFVGRLIGEAYTHAELAHVPDPGNPAGSIGGSAPPSAAADVNALALQAAHSATAATHDLIGLATEGGPFAGYVSHQIVLHLADALDAAIKVHRHAEDEGDPVDARLLHLAELLTNFLESQNG